MRTGRGAVLVLLLTIAAGTARGGANLVQDPGFETFRLDRQAETYLPAPDSPWVLLPTGTESIVFDGSRWSAPDAMKRVRRRGFAPGTRGPDRTATDGNTGAFTLRQDLVAPETFAQNTRYEAWVWLGGAGRDNGGGGSDTMDEAGGWTAAFYASANPAEWTETNALEIHTASFDFFGEPETFVQIAGQGRIPSGAQGVRLTVEARTWYAPTGPAASDCAVALDNAHFAVLDHPNLLYNGDFERDENPIDFKGWKRPARHAFADNSLNPLKVLDVYRNQSYYQEGWDHHFDHGYFLPFVGNRVSYGYITFLRGWQEAASFSFSQTVDFEQSGRTPLTYMFYWVQDTQQPGDAWQLRENGGQIESVLQYFKGDKEIGSETFITDWPSPSVMENRSRYDQNGHKAYNPRYRVIPPRGTDSIEVNVCVHVRHPWAEGRSHVAFAVDDFYLGVANED